MKSQLTYPPTETRIFARLPMDPGGAIIEAARLPHGGNFHQIHEALRELPRFSEVDILYRAVDPARFVERRGHRRLDCSRGRVRQNFAAIQAAAAAPEPGVLFV